MTDVESVTSGISRPASSISRSSWYPRSRTTSIESAASALWDSEPNSEWQSRASSRASRCSSALSTRSRCSLRLIEKREKEMLRKGTEILFNLKFFLALSY